MYTECGRHEHGKQARCEHWRCVRIDENSTAFSGRLGQTHSGIHGASTERSGRKKEKKELKCTQESNKIQTTVYASYSV